MISWKSFWSGTNCLRHASRSMCMCSFNRNTACKHVWPSASSKSTISCHGQRVVAYDKLYLDLNMHNYFKNSCRHFSYSHKKLLSDQKDKNLNDLDGEDEELNELKQLDKIKDDPELRSILDDIKKDFEDKSRSKKKDEKKDVIPEDSNIPKSAGGLQGSAETPSVHEDLQLLEEIEKDLEYDYRVADDIEEYEYKDARELAQQQIREEKILPISLERGQSGVFDLNELVILLEDLGAQDIVTVPVPPEANYCDHMMVVSAKSKRHLQAINDELLWVHKRKKSSRDHHLVIEGRDRSDWCAMDMGNIVLHIFYGPAREYYDIESLWTLGPDCDPKCQEQGHDPYALSPEDLFWLETSKSSDSASPETPLVEDVKEGTTTSSEDEHLHSKKPQKWPRDVTERDAGWGSSKHPTVD